MFIIEALFLVVMYFVFVVLLYSFFVEFLKADFVFEKRDGWIGYYNSKEKFYIFLIPYFGIYFKKKNIYEKDKLRMPSISIEGRILESEIDNNGNTIIKKFELDSESFISDSTSFINEEEK